MSSAGSRYDSIGHGYRQLRQPDPRIAAKIEQALGDARTVIDVGSGTGSYEPTSRTVTAIEPSWTMISQRTPKAAPVVQGVGEALPFEDGTFDAATAVLTVHHWTDAAAGLSEMRRVARNQVVVTWHPGMFASFWLVDEYLPQIADHEANLATLTAVKEGLPGAVSSPLPVPADCTDGFAGAYWRRPEAYLDPRVRASISSLAMLDQATVEDAMKRLSNDLETGRWKQRHGDLLELDELDVGYRIVSA